MEEDKNLKEITSQSTEITKSSATVLSDIRNTVDENAKSLTAAINMGKILLANSQNVEEMTDDMDRQIADYIKRSATTVTAMKDRRKKITQIFDLVKSGFTKMEAMLDKKSVDSIPYKLQVQRDKYAAYKLEQQRKAEEERKRGGAERTSCNRYQGHDVGYCHDNVKGASRRHERDVRLADP